MYILMKKPIIRLLHLQQVLRSLFVDLLIQKTLKVKSSVTKRDNAYSVPRLTIINKKVEYANT